MIAEQVGIDRQTVWQIITEELSTTNRQSTCLPACAEEFARRRRRDLFDLNTWMLHHDNEPAHSYLSVRCFLAEKNVSVLDQPPYSPDLAPCNFFLLPRLKGIIMGIRFTDVEAIKKAMARELRAIPVQAFQDGMTSWQRRMESCVEKQGDYFGGCERKL